MLQKRFEIRCSAEELAIWRTAAGGMGLSLATWIRTRLNGEGVRTELLSEAVVRTEHVRTTPIRAQGVRTPQTNVATPITPETPVANEVKIQKILAEVAGVKRASEVEPPKYRCRRHPLLEQDGPRCIRGCARY